MTVDPAVIPGLFLLAAELFALAAVGYVVARVALRQTNDLLALAQGLVIGLALWGLIVNFLLHLIPGMAGALAGWIVVLALGAGLAWRNRHALPIPPRTLAGFGLASAAVFWIALASRQLLIIPDEPVHATLSSTIRAGGWPPIRSWNPDLDLSYHYGIDLLIGLLMPPVGPDLGFTTEVLGAYAWVCLVMLVVALLLRRGSPAGTLVLSPLLLAPGAWTLVFGEQPAVTGVPVPVGIPAAGLRAALSSVYWPHVELPWPSEQHGVPPNIWKPLFPFAYALAFLILERVAVWKRTRWPGALTLALLVGFLGLVDESVAPVVLATWTVMEFARVLRHRSHASANLVTILGAAVGPTLAATLLAGGGGVLTGAITGTGSTGSLALGWPLDPRDRSALLSVTMLGGGLGLLHVGTLVVGSAAVVLALRDRFVLLLVGASLAFLIAALTLRYEEAPHDVARFDGHARNFALLALALALGLRIRALPRLRRYAVAGVVFGLVTWPTVATPARNLGLAIGHGVEVANASDQAPEFGDWYWYMGRYAPQQPLPEMITTWIRDNTATDSRILSPVPLAMTIATGRPNSAGFTRFPHGRPTFGPEYLDSIRHLEPAALTRLKIQYVHAPDHWVAELPDRARRWLAEPHLFEPLIRDGTDTLYRVRPEIRNLDLAPATGTYEALRLAARNGSRVFLSKATDPLNTVRAAASMPHAQFLGSGSPSDLSIRDLSLGSDVRPEPLDARLPDLVVASARLAPSIFSGHVRRPVFWNDEIAIYSPNGSVAPVMPPPQTPFQVNISNWQVTTNGLTFTATLSNFGGENWTGQDWVVVRADESPWAFPRSWPVDRTPQWFAGQIAPQSGTIRHGYEFDPRAGRLALRNSDGTRNNLPSAGAGLGQGVWLLSVRLRDDYRLVALVPVAKISIAAGGDVSYHVYEGEVGIRPTLGPIASPWGRF